MNETTQYVAMTALGVPIHTFASRDLAVSWWDEKAWEFPGASLQAVTEKVFVVRRTIRRDRAQVAA